MGRGADKPRLGTITMPSGQEDGRFFDHFENQICDLLAEAIDLAEGQRVWVGFESPFLASARWDPKLKRLVQAKTNIKTLRRLYGLATFTAVVCWRFNNDYAPGVECREVAIGTVKKELAGRGDADKLDLWASARRLGFDPANADEADALGGWLVMCRHYGGLGWSEWATKLESARVFRPKTKTARKRKPKAL